MWETRVRSLGWEDRLEDKMATHSSILARKIPWTEEPHGLRPWGRKEWDTTKQLSMYSPAGGDTPRPEVGQRKVYQLPEGEGTFHKGR